MTHFRLFPAWAALAPAFITPAVTADTTGRTARALEGQQEATE